MLENWTFEIWKSKLIFGRKTSWNWLKFTTERKTSKKLYLPQEEDTRVMGHL